MMLMTMITFLVLVDSVPVGTCRDDLFAQARSVHRWYPFPKGLPFNESCRVPFDLIRVFSLSSLL